MTVINLYTYFCVCLAFEGERGRKKEYYGERRRIDREYRHPKINSNAHTRAGRRRGKGEGVEGNRKIFFLDIISHFFFLLLKYFAIIRMLSSLFHVYAVSKKKKKKERKNYTNFVAECWTTLRTYGMENDDSLEERKKKENI